MNEHATALIAKAEKTIESMKEAERRSGFASPEDVAPGSLLDTAILALESGICIQDWDCAAEAYVMLETLYEQITGRKHKRI